MRIKRFFENEQVELSNERADEIINEVEDFLDVLNEKNKYLESLIIELNNYKNLSDKEMIK